MMRFTAITLCLLVSASLAFAHGDGDHAHDEEPAAAVLATGSSPRLEAVGSDIELVASVADRQLTIFLDRPATNEPIDGATIAVTADGIPAGTAKALGAGAYVLPAPWADEPGVKPLKFAITTGSGSSVLEGTLQVGGALHAVEAKDVAWHSLLEQPLTWV